MASLQITRGDLVTRLRLDDPAHDWMPAWFPSDDPDVPDMDARSMKTAEGLVLFEIAVGNTSILPGNKGATKPGHACSVGIGISPGWSIVSPIGHNRGFPTLWPIGRETWRRLVCYPNNRPELARKAQLLANGPWHPKWRANQKSYGPCNMPLPLLSAGQHPVIFQHDKALLAGLSNGIHGDKLDDSEDAVLMYSHGWFPHGPPRGDTEGGSGIYFSQGWRQNDADRGVAMAMAPSEHERMLHYRHRATGLPLSVDHYPGTGPSPDLWGDVLPEIKGVPNFDPLPPPYDFAHRIRGRRRTHQLAQQVDSPMARYSVASGAAYGRMQFSERGRMPVPGYHPENLATWEQQVANAPGTGLWGKIGGRMMGWTFYDLAMDAKVNGWTAGNQAYAERVLAMIGKGATAAGVFQKGYGGSFPSVVDAAGKAIYVMQTFEYDILAYGVIGLATQLGGGSSAATRAILNGLGQIYGPDTLIEIGPYYGGKGPWKWIHVADSNGPIAPLDKGEPLGGNILGDATHAESGIALALHMQSRGSSAWLQRAAMYDDPAPTWKDKLRRLEAQTRLDWEGFLYGQLQTAEKEGWA